MRRFQLSCWLPVLVAISLATLCRSDQFFSAQTAGQGQRGNTGYNQQPNNFQRGSANQGSKTSGSRYQQPAAAGQSNSNKYQQTTPNQNLAGGVAQTPAGSQQAPSGYQQGSVGLSQNNGIQSAIGLAESSGGFQQGLGTDFQNAGGLQQAGGFQQDQFGTQGSFGGVNQGPGAVPGLGDLPLQQDSGAFQPIQGGFQQNIQEPLSGAAQNPSEFQDGLSGFQGDALGLDQTTGGFQDPSAGLANPGVQGSNFNGFASIAPSGVPQDASLNGLQGSYSPAATGGQSQVGQGAFNTAPQVQGQQNYGAGPSSSGSTGYNSVQSGRGQGASNQQNQNYNKAQGAGQNVAGGQTNSYGQQQAQTGKGQSLNAQGAAGTLPNFGETLGQFNQQPLNLQPQGSPLGDVNAFQSPLVGSGAQQPFQNVPEALSNGQLQLDGQANLGLSDAPQLDFNNQGLPNGDLFDSNALSGAQGNQFTPELELPQVSPQLANQQNVPQQQQPNLYGQQQAQQGVQGANTNIPSIQGHSAGSSGLGFAAQQPVTQAQNFASQGGQYNGAAQSAGKVATPQLGGQGATQPAYGSVQQAQPNPFPASNSLKSTGPSQSGGYQQGAAGGSAKGTSNNQGSTFFGAPFTISTLDTQIKANAAKTVAQHFKQFMSDNSGFPGTINDNAGAPKKPSSTSQGQSKYPQQNQQSQAKPQYPQQAQSQSRYPQQSQTQSQPQQTPAHTQPQYPQQTQTAPQIPQQTQSYSQFPQQVQSQPQYSQPAKPSSQLQQQPQPQSQYFSQNQPQSQSQSRYPQQNQAQSQYPRQNQQQTPQANQGQSQYPQQGLRPQANQGQSQYKQQKQKPGTQANQGQSQYTQQNQKPSPQASQGQYTQQSQLPGPQANQGQYSQQSQQPGLQASQGQYIQQSQQQGPQAHQGQSQYKQQGQSQGGKSTRY